MISRAVTADAHLLACIEAYGEGRLRFEQVVARMFVEDVHHYPRDLCYDAFLALVLKVIERIEGGVVQVPASLRVDYPDVYEYSDG
jgi:hypothetical protein